MYYFYQKNIFTDLRHKSLFYYTKTLESHIYTTRGINYLTKSLSKDPRFRITLLDKDAKLVYSSEQKIFIPKLTGFSEHNGRFFYSDSIEHPNNDHIKYVIVSIEGVQKLLHQVSRSIFLFLLFSIVFLTAVVYLLGQLFLQPVRDAIQKLDHFIRDTTHELNTPVSVITMSLERLKESVLNEIQQKHVNRIMVASRTISNLYNDLTFLMMHDRVSVQPVSLNIAEVIQERVEYFNPLAETKKLTVLTELNDTNITIYKDEFILLVDNLLSNAIKYNKPFGRISISLFSDKLVVEDTGIGIAEEHLNDIFRRYSRFDDANGGFGIGLSIIQIICQKSGFQISVESDVGVGSKFIIQLGSNDFNA